jgi:hypothetical protein
MLANPAQAGEFLVFVVVFAAVLVVHRKRWLQRGLLPVFQEQSSVAYQRLNLLP